MTKNPIPGIFMIRNKSNSKIFIGQTKDVRARYMYYREIALTGKKPKRAVAVPIEEALSQSSWDNFEFTILESGQHYADLEQRRMQEIFLIDQYKSYLPDIGYNVATPETSDDLKNRTVRRLPNALPIITYDIVTQRSMLYLGGASALAEEVGYERSVITRSILRGSLVLGRYYIFYVDDTKRHQVIDDLRSVKTDTHISISTKHDPKSKHAREGRRRSADAFNSYIKVANQMDDIVRDYGF